jgi:hypothetical protein
MSHKNANEPDRLLDQIVIALREQSIPELVDPHIAIPVRKASDTRAESAATRTDSRGRRRSPVRWSITGSILALVAILVIAVPAIIPNGQPRMAFAQVQQAVSAVKSFRCRYLDFHGDQDPYVTTVVSVRGIGSRSEGSNVSETITNFKAQRLLYIDHRGHKARIYQLYSHDGKGGVDTFEERIRNLPAAGAKELGTTVFNGKKVLQFAFSQFGEFVVLVDPDTKLPLRMELKMDKGLSGGAVFREVITDFLFDAPVEESLFEIKAPPGYVVERCEEPMGRKRVDTKTLVVSATKGVGPVPMGASKEKVIAFFGKPDFIETVHHGLAMAASPGGPATHGQKDILRERLHYESLGFEVSLSSDEGMTEVRCFGPSLTARGFLGKTDAKIGLDCAIGDVLKAYGEPEAKSRIRDDELHYFHKGWSFLFDDGKLTSFSASKPMSDQIEIEAHDDGSWTERIKPKDKSP